jgi:peroxiredoxin Q/BCP
MSKTSTGKKVPDISLPATGDKRIRLSDYRGRNVVLYFYPRDNTPGCTLEGQDFRDHYRDFRKKDTDVIGVSRDSIAAHERFKAAQKFPFDLIADTEEKLCSLFGVIKMKNMYGKKVRGIERSTFLIGADGVLRQAWRKVKVQGHVEEVLAAIDQM